MFSVTFLDNIIVACDTAQYFLQRMWKQARNQCGGQLGNCPSRNFQNTFSCYVQKQVTIILTLPKISAGCVPVRSGCFPHINCFAGNIWSAKQVFFMTDKSIFFADKYIAFIIFLTRLSKKNLRTTFMNV